MSGTVIASYDARRAEPKQPPNITYEGKHCPDCGRPPKTRFYNGNVIYSCEKGHRWQYA